MLRLCPEFSSVLTSRWTARLADKVVEKGSDCGLEQKSHHLPFCENAKR